MTSNMTTTVNRCVDVTLVTHAGTGYIWTLTALSGGVALTEIADLASTRNVGGALRQVFTFVGTKASTATASFALIRPWEADQPVDTREVTIEVQDAGAEEALVKAAGSGSFVHGSYHPAPAATACGDEGQMVLESSSNCTLKYGIPPNAPNCNLKYGIPIRPLYAINPPDNIVARYMAQPPKK